MWSLGSFSSCFDSSLSFCLNSFYCCVTCEEIYMYVNIWYKYIIGYTIYNICVFHPCDNIWYKYILGYNICGICVLHSCEKILVCVNIWFRYIFQSICIIYVNEHEIYLVSIYEICVCEYVCMIWSE